MGNKRSKPRQPRDAADHDILDGAEAIAKWRRWSLRRTYYMCETGQIPAIKEGGVWTLSKGAYLRKRQKFEAGSAD
jgi:hypothetical protein